MRTYIFKKMDKQSFKIFYKLVLILLIITHFVFAQRYEFKPNYDESQIPGFKLPDLLKSFKGKKIRNSEKWMKIGRHELLALIAPRPVYVASAEGDKWSDPKGEFLSAYYATMVYELFEKKGIPSKKMPEVNQPIQHTVAYHIRTGKHDVTAFDWDQYIKWAKEQILTNSNTNF